MKTVKYSDSPPEKIRALTAIKRFERTLTGKLTVVLVLKLAVLLALWLGFVRDQRVTLDAERVAAQLLQPVAPTQGPKP